MNSSHPDFFQPNPNVSSEEFEVQRQFLSKVADGTVDNTDYLQVANSYTRQAEEGDALAQYNLGIMHALGQGFVRDTAEAAVWFQKAANQGNAAAQHQMGVALQRMCFTASPSETTECKIEAYKWFQLSSAQGYLGSADACSQISLKMTHEDVSDGNRRIAAFETTPSTRSEG